MTDEAAVIRTYDLTKHYGRKVGCEKICLSVQRGHIFGFLGPNGAGKSTFVKMMTGLIEPSSGRAELLGAPVGDFRARSRIGFLPENFRYQDWLTPAELLRFHGRLLGMEPSDVGRDARRVLDEVGLAGEDRTRIRNFSKGMQQRLGLACALLGRPELLFLDEPTSALDPIGRAEVRQLLVDVRRRGTTVFLNSHLLGEVEAVCDEVAVIDRGRVVEAGPLAELLAGQCEVEIALAGPVADDRVRTVAAAVGGRLISLSPDLAVIGLPDEGRVPDVVAGLVRAGARIQSVARRRRTLESLFLEVVSDGHSG
jgi:ABC-2 type transport system ATP-binding protein